MLTGKLTARKVAQVTSVGRHGDGGGLYLVVNDGGSKQWMLRTTVHGTRRDIGLGGINYVTLPQAREEARRLRAIARNGKDPRAERNRETLTFEQAAVRVYEAHKPTWKNAKHAEQWITTLRTYAFPHFGGRQIDTVQSADVLRALTPIWTEKPETAKRLRQRISTVFDWAKSAGHYPFENPVAGIKKALPKINAKPQHLAALPWCDLPAFVNELTQREGISAFCLRFIILTALRSGEARGLRWAEIDGATLVVPEPPRVYRRVFCSKLKGTSIY